MPSSLFAPLAHLEKAAVEAGLTLADEATSRILTDLLKNRYLRGTWPLGILWSDELFEACCERIEGLVLWAEAPRFPLMQGSESTAAFFFDPRRPKELLYTPSIDLPAVLFVPLPAQIDAMHAVLHEFDPRHVQKTRAQRTRSLRAFAGNVSSLAVPDPYSGSLIHATSEALGKFFAMSPAVDPQGWGSAFAENPLKLRGAGLDNLQHVVLAREMGQQIKDAVVATTTREGYFSGGYLGMQMHPGPGQLYFWDIAYAPARVTTDVVAAFNARFGYQFPRDMPIDLVAAIHGFSFMGAASIQDRIDVENGYKLVLLGLVYDDLPVVEKLVRKFASHPDVAHRAAVVDACYAYNWKHLLVELGIREKDPKLQAYVRELLLCPCQAMELDPVGEPVDFLLVAATGLEGAAS